MAAAVSFVFPREKIDAPRLLLPMTKYKSEMIPNE